jgi:hypothetical protein
MIGYNLYSGAIDFTQGSLSKTLGLSGGSTGGSNIVYVGTVEYLAGLTSGLDIQTGPTNYLPQGTVISSISGDYIELSNPVGFTGDTFYYIGLTGGRYILSNALFIDPIGIANVDDIPNYQIGASAGSGVRPFAVYAQTRKNDQWNIRGTYNKYIVTNVVDRNPSDSTFTAYIEWAGTGTESEYDLSIDTSSNVLPFVELSPNGLLPPIEDYRMASFLNLPEGQPFNTDIINVLDGGGLGIKEVYSQFEQIVGGTTGVPYATSFNFIDGGEDQVNYIEAYVDPAYDKNEGKVIVSVKTPGFQKSTIGIYQNLTYTENQGQRYIAVTRALSGESDKLVPSLVKVNYSFQNGTAINGQDYGGTSGSLSFTPTSPTSLSIPVKLNDNFIIEGSRYFYLNYSIDSIASTGSGIFSYIDNSGVTGATGFSTVNINDNDSPNQYNFKFSIANKTEWEPKSGNAGKTGPFYALPVKFNLSSPGSVNADSGGVTLNLLNTGTGVRGSDYAIYYSGTVDTSGTSWALDFTNGTDPDVPVYVVPLRNPSKYNTNTTVIFNLSGPTAASSAQPSVGFPVSIQSPSTFTFNINEADRTTNSTFTFTSSSYANVGEGLTGQFVIQRNVTPFGGYPQDDPNVNYVEPATSSVQLTFNPSSSAEKVTNFNPVFQVFDVSSGGNSVQPLNFTSTNTATLNFNDGEYAKYVRVSTVAVPLPTPPKTLSVGISGPSAIIDSYNYGVTGSIIASNFTITDNSTWSVSTFSVSASQTSVQQPTVNDTPITLSINRSLNSPNGSIPDPIRISYKIESTGANGAILGEHFSVGLPLEDTIDFPSNLNTYTIPVNILKDPLSEYDGQRQFKITIYQPSYDSPSVSNLALIQGYNSSDTQAIDSETVYINDTYVPPDYNRIFYQFHGGGGNGFPNTVNMTDPAVLYKLPTGAAPFYYETSNLSEVMTAMINGNSEGGTPTPGFFTVIKNFTLGPNVSIPQAGTSVQWTYSATTQPNYYYLAVPQNPAPNSQYYSQDLTGQTLYLRNSFGPTRSAQKKNFVYNGKDYVLYRMSGDANTVSTVFSFNS